jgi:Ca2+-binding EF-hand superfamily protein
MFKILDYHLAPEVLDDLLQTVDTDNSGDLSFPEFISLIVLVGSYLDGHQPPENIYEHESFHEHEPPYAGPPLSPEDRQRYQELFDSVDTDGGGSICTSELGHLFTNLGYETSESQMNDLIAMVDTDGDGELNFAEFVDLINRYLESQQTAA